MPVLLLLISTLVFRMRDAQVLAANPLDQAAIFRVACVGSALLMGWIALFLPGRRNPNDEYTNERLTSRPFRLFSLYVIVVFIGALTSILPLFTVYRGVELMVLLIVYMGARRSVGSAAIPRIENVLYWWLVGSLASVWLGALLVPHDAFIHIDSPIPWQLQGAYPAISSNGVGGMGALLALWSLGRLGHGADARPSWFNILMAMGGLLSLVAGQYRTGYVATALGLVVLLALRRRVALAGLVLVAATFVTVASPVLLARAQPYLLRGQSEQRASELSGRRYFWDLAIPVWKKSPVIGRGLLTASRFEVLAPAGFGGISTIHGTWIEALLGTGIIGVALLAGSVLMSWRRALAEALRRNGPVVPVLILTTLSVQSVTGSDFAVFGFGTLLYLGVALSLRDTSHNRPPPGAGGPPFFSAIHLARRPPEASVGSKGQSTVSSPSPRFLGDIAPAFDIRSSEPGVGG